MQAHTKPARAHALENHGRDVLFMRQEETKNYNLAYAMNRILATV